MKLEEMTFTELQELKMDKLYCMNGIIRMCKEMGNKEWQNNVMVKAYADKIREVDKILNERERRGK